MVISGDVTVNAIKAKKKSTFLHSVPEFQESTGLAHWMNMEQWWNDTDRAKLQYSEKNLSHCYFVHRMAHLGSNPSLFIALKTKN